MLDNLSDLPGVGTETTPHGMSFAGSALCVISHESLGIAAHIGFDIVLGGLDVVMP